MRLILCMLSYFTRIPVRFSRWPSGEEMRACLAWLPLSGLVTGVVAAGVWRVALLWWGLPVATLLAMLALYVCGGAMHEDGFCDACDALGVPGPRERVLQVLKDPQMGTFGVLGMAMLVAFRYTFWSGLSLEHWWWMPASEAISRIAMPYWSWTRPYARKEGPSKADYLRGESAPPWALYAGIAVCVGLMAYAGFGLRGLLALFAGILASAIPVYVYQKKVGGVTGDVLGAAQQCALLAVWLVLLARVA